MAGDLSGFAGRSVWGTAEALRRDLGQGLEPWPTFYVSPPLNRGIREKTGRSASGVKARRRRSVQGGIHSLRSASLSGSTPGPVILGTPESVTQLTRDDLLHWYRRYAAFPTTSSWPS